jgi:hypothetical protein
MAVCIYGIGTLILILIGCWIYVELERAPVLATVAVGVYGYAMCGLAYRLGLAGPFESVMK